MRANEEMSDLPCAARDEIVTRRLRLGSHGAPRLPIGQILHAAWKSMEAVSPGDSQGKMAFLIRHAAFHTLDHAWEMEDRDLTAELEA